MNKKRGMLLVVLIPLVIFLIILPSSVNSQEQNDFVKYQIIKLQMECDEAADCNVKAQVKNYCINMVDCTNNVCGNGYPGEVDVDEFPKSFPPAEDGCYMNVYETYGILELDEACGWGLIKSGLIVDDNPKKMKGNLVGSFRYDGDDAKYIRDYTHFYFKDKLSLICDGGEEGGGYWRQCDEDHVGQMLEVDVEPEDTGENAEAGSTQELVKDKFFCLKDANNNYVWRNGEMINPAVDQDLDSVPDVLDCAPNDARVFGEWGCSWEIDLNEEGAVKSCSEDSQCGESEQYRCNELFFCEEYVCEGEGQAEICSDGLDNDCSEWDQKTEDYNYKNDDVDVGCDDNEDSCLTNCRGGGEICAWINSMDNTNCCGGKGFEDLGKITKQVGGGDDYICLNEDYVGTGFDFKTSESIEGEGQWHWVHAGGSAKFNIFTIKKPGQEPFDIVSNGESWSVCNETTTSRPLEKPISMTLKEQTNRFYCYQEGKHWSWAECYDGGELVNKDTSKVRYSGDALYSLPLGSAPSSKFVELTPENSGYHIHYDRDYFDFSNYDYLNFFVRFTNDQLKSPANVILELYSPGDAELYKGNVLGYAASNAVLNTNQWIKIEFPLNGIKYVNKINIITNKPDHNLMEIRNVYLTKEEEKTRFCSGEDSLDNNIWMTDFDVVSPLSGENICNVLFDPDFVINPETQKIEGKAWLGEEGLCCGDDGKEDYYAGQGKGCWKGQVIEPGTPVMDVSFDVEYEESRKEIKEMDVPFSYVVEATYKFESYSPIEDVVINSVTPSDPQLFSEEGAVFDVTYNDGSNDKIDILSDQFKDVKRRPEFNGSTSISGHFTVPIPDLIDEIITVPIPDLIDEISTGKYDPVNLNFRLVKLNVITENEEVILTLTDDSGIVSDILRPQNKFDSLVLHAETDKITINEIPPSSKSGFFTHSCSLPECVFPLPGQAPFIIANPNPHLYELWFVDENEQGTRRETLIAAENKGNDQFATEGNIVAKKISQQIIYNSDDEKLDYGFYGCQTPDSLKNSIPAGVSFELVDYCQMKGDRFCSYSFTEDFTSINSWSNESITKMGYDLGTTAEPKIGAIFNLKKLEQPILSSERNQSTAVLPARNFLSNAEFIVDGQLIPFWEILENGVFKKNILNNIDKETKTITLSEGEILRSDRIAVMKDTTLHFQQSGTCMPQFTLADRNGQITIETNLEFYTGESSFLFLEFKGPCTVQEPMLQVVDEFGMINYSYVSRHPEILFDARSGAACCPSNSCWNGYACVEEMKTYTFLSEHIEEGRDYRCVQGKWKALPIRKDWNAAKYGFCDYLDQCFVLGSEEGASLNINFLNINNNNLPNNKLDAFYEGQTPTCISDGEYLLDYYCDNGNWTSRTKFIANKLLELVGDDEYVIYCSDYRDTLISPYDHRDDFLGGTQLKKVTQTAGGSALMGEVSPEKVRTCFNLDKAEEQGLITKKQNTCINNVCVLEHKGKIAFATTLNKPADSPDSFLITLGLDPSKLSSACQGEEDFINCNFPGVDFGYSPRFNAVFYNLDVDPSFFSKAVDGLLGLFKNLFGKGSALENQKGFLMEAQNFRDLYLLNKNNKQIRAVREILSAGNKTLVAEYEGFTAPLCDYLANEKIDHEELKLELLEEESGMIDLSCVEEEGLQRVEAVNGLDFLWPQLTGKLRPS